MGTQTQRAKILGCAQSTISRLDDGRLSPKLDMRKAIHMAGGPEPSEWDEPVPATPTVIPRVAPPPAPPVVSGGATPEAARAMADRVMVLAQGLLHEIENLTVAETDGIESSLEKRVRLAEKATAVVANLGKLTGASELNERRIMAAPAFRELIDRILAALKPHPEAMAAILDVLQPEELVK